MALTWKQRALVLRARLERGPEWSLMGLDPEAREVADADYQRWARNWVLPDLDALVPELNPSKGRKR